MDNVIDFYKWVFCLSPFAGYCYYFSVGDRLSILKSKGIYNPIYGIWMALAFIITLLCTSFEAYLFFYDDGWGDTDYTLAVLLPLEAIFVLMYVLCKFLLPKISNRQIRKTSTKTDYHKWAKIMVFAFVVSVMACFYYQKHILCFWYGNDWASFCADIIVLIFTGVISYKIYLSMNRYETIKEYANRTLSALETQRSPIIFLRSFMIDKTPINGKTFDEYICANFPMSMQPIISLSDPDDYLPTGGSIKIQSKDEKWENAVNILIKNCRAIVIFEGKSESLKTEMAKIKDFSIPYDKVFVATPPQKYRLKAWLDGAWGGKKYVLQYIWKDFSTSMDKIGGIAGFPAKEPGGSRIFSLNSSGQCVEEKGGKEGTDFFEYIMKKTIKYESLPCDYKRLAVLLKDNELDMEITDAENRMIRRAMIKISIISFAVSVLSVFMGYIIFK